MVVDMVEWKQKRLLKAAMPARRRVREGVTASVALVGGLVIATAVPAVRNWGLHHAFAIVLTSIAGWGLYEMCKPTPKR
jgi:hypothetical protein